MLIIRPEQLKVFQPVAEADFEWRVLNYLREHHADATVGLPTGETTVADIPHATLLGMLRHGIRRARAYGMTWESTLTIFVVAMLMSAPNFDDHPLIKRILDDAEIEPDSRLDALWERTTEENWEAVKQQYDSRAWNLDD